MKIIKTPIEDILVIEPKVFSDERGYFFESWSRSVFESEELSLDFVQGNQSFSCKGVLRGLHFQNPPYAQGKLMQVISGSVLDVAVDIRKESATYGQYFSIVLSGKNKKSLWLRPGFAHGFITLEDDTILTYKCTGFYHKQSEGAIIWNDKDLGINWVIERPNI
jgi:dTDP-4-dehydrorhamnose 3,5-epimerase